MFSIAEVILVYELLDTVGPAIPELLLAAQLNATECVVLLTQVPVSAAEFGEFVALLISVTVPLTLPVAFGLNATFSSAVCRRQPWIR